MYLYRATLAVTCGLVVLRSNAMDPPFCRLSQQSSVTEDLSKSGSHGVLRHNFAVGVDMSRIPYFYGHDNLSVGLKF